MPVIQGQTSGSIVALSYDIPSTIKSFSIVNRTAGTINFIVGVLVGDGNFRYIRYGTLNASEDYVDDVNVRLLAGYQIWVQVSGTVDYYFSLE